MTSNEVLLGCTRSELALRAKALEREQQTRPRLHPLRRGARRARISHDERRGSTAVLRALQIGQCAFLTAYGVAFEASKLAAQLRPKRFRCKTTPQGVVVTRIL